MIPFLLLTLPFIPYEPEIVQLTGILHASIYPGPPEYESIANGDEPEHVFILTLDSPIHVEDSFSQEDSWNDPEDNVTEIQVAAHPDDAQHLVGERVTVTGTLFHAHTAHHKTKVLIIDKHIEPVK